MNKTIRFFFHLFSISAIISCTSKENAKKRELANSSPIVFQDPLLKWIYEPIYLPENAPLNQTGLLRLIPLKDNITLIGTADLNAGSPINEDGDFCFSLVLDSPSIVLLNTLNPSISYTRYSEFRMMCSPFDLKKHNKIECEVIWANQYAPPTKPVALKFWEEKKVKTLFRNPIKRLPKPGERIRVKGRLVIDLSYYKYPPYEDSGRYGFHPDYEIHPVSEIVFISQ